MALLRRSNDPTPAPDAPPTPEAGTPSGSGKGRPTPTRREAEAANRRPLVPSDRKAAAKAARSRSREEREVRMRGMQAGDERFLPARDRGPQRRYARDYVDARWNVGEFFLPIALVFFVVMIFTNRSQSPVSLLLLVLLYGLVLLAIVDAFVMWQKLKRRLRAKFGDVEKGTAFYSVTRAFQMRRTRVPRPTSPKRGAYPA